MPLLCSVSYVQPVAVPMKAEVLGVFGLVGLQVVGSEWVVCVKFCFWINLITVYDVT